MPRECVCVRMYTHAFIHTRLRVVSSWTKACLWERMMAGWFWFCLVPWEASQIFLLERILLLDRWGRTSAPLLLHCWLCQSSKLPKAQPSVTPSSGACRRWRLQICRSLALCSATRTSCESLGAGVGSRSLSWSARTVHAAPAWGCVSCQWAIGFTSCLKKALPPEKEDVRGDTDVGGRGTVLHLFRQFKIP